MKAGEILPAGAFFLRRPCNGHLFHVFFTCLAFGDKVKEMT